MKNFSPSRATLLFLLVVTCAAACAFVLARANSEHQRLANEFLDVGVQCFARHGHLYLDEDGHHVVCSIEGSGKTEPMKELTT